MVELIKSLIIDVCILYPIITRLELIFSYFARVVEFAQKIFPTPRYENALFILALGRNTIYKTPYTDLKDTL